MGEEILREGASRGHAIGKQRRTNWMGKGCGWERGAAVGRGVTGEGNGKGN